jgi:phosphoribosyl-ATP pyrophosphohydrolase/phosphoribosyl-AMP cyclohydrolase
MMEEGVRVIDIKWNEQGLVPAVVQDANTGQVLMLAYMNQASLEWSWFWSRSRGELWHKGATSGNTQRVEEIRYDCDADTLLLRVEPAGPACHTGHQSCFYRRLPDGGRVGEALPSSGVLAHLEAVIQDRKANPRPGSYTCQLLDAGLPRILNKVGEGGYCRRPERGRRAAGQRVGRPDLPRPGVAGCLRPVLGRRGGRVGAATCGEQESARFQHFVERQVGGFHGLSRRIRR